MSAQPAGGPSPGGRAARVSLRIRRWRADVLVPAAATDGRYALVEHHVTPGTVTMPRHAYAREVVTYYALAGTVTLALDGRDVRLAAGETAVVAAGTRHAVLVRAGDGAGRDGDEPARVLAALAPGGADAFYAEVAAAISPTGVPDMPAIHAACARSGVAVDMASLYELTERYGVHLA